MAAFSFFSRNNNENIKSLKPSEFRELISENTIKLEMGSISRIAFHLLNYIQ